MFTEDTYDYAEHKTSSDLTAAQVFKFQQNKTSRKRLILQRFHGILASSKCNATISSKEIAFMIQTNSTYSCMESNNNNHIKAAQPHLSNLNSLFMLAEI
jgi:hypothetical protein